ncbi:hypothetical protein LCGC14_1889830 [marine sediment metagenome]|uniref:Uncharacterized protein n=1 Tax=marine sediment metagenome TaxID=412755 RepID=A0A0F9IY09_9ZZZZ
MIRFLIDTTVAKPDIYGNCYSYSIVTSTKTGNTIAINSGAMSSGGNVTAILRRVGFEWSEIHYSESVIPIRQFNARLAGLADPVHEHLVTAVTLLALENGKVKV